MQFSNVQYPPRSKQFSRYKAEIAFVSPPSRRHTFHEQQECFLGISLENGNFTPLKLRGLVQWVSRRFARCTVLVGDAIHRITLESTRSLQPSDALVEAKRLGREFVRENGNIFNEFRDRANFTFLTCSEVQTWPSYDVHYGQLREYFDTDLDFRSSVEEFGRRYHSKSSDVLTHDEQDLRISRSCDYFLEEFAIFASLQQRGLSVMVYPGSFSTLTEVASGRHPGAPPELLKLTVVSLNLKGRL